MNLSVVPPTGWHFEQNETRIDGNGFDDLVKNVTAYRTYNQLPAGSPSAEIEAFIYRKWPHVFGAVSTTVRAQIVDVDEPPKVYGQRAQRTTAERIGSWASNRYSRLGSIDLVDKDEAERRAGICLNCPKNDPKWREKVIANCPPCKERLDALDATLYKIRQGKSVTRKPRLGACLASGQCNESAVWLGEKNLQHAKHYLQDLAAGCWMIPFSQSGEESSTG